MGKIVWSLYINESITHYWKRKKDALDDVQKCLLEGCDVTLTRVELVGDEYKYDPVNIQFLRELTHTILEKHYNMPVPPLPQAVLDDVMKSLSPFSGLDYQPGSLIEAYEKGKEQS